MILGLDLGTTHIKAAVFDDHGRVVRQASRPVSLYTVPGGGVEQDLEEIWSATVASIREASGADLADHIRAIGVSSQGGAMQLMTASGQCLGRIVSWLDQRGSPFDERLTRELGGAWFQERILHGASWLCIGQLLRLREQAAHGAGRLDRIRFVGDAIVERLCGRACQDGTSAALTLLYDPRHRTYAEDVLARLGVSADQLPALLPPNLRAGALTATAAQATDLPLGIPVGPAVHDQYAAALGTGVVEAGSVMLGTGTAWVLLAVTEQAPVPAHAHALISHHVVEPLWGQILSMGASGSAIRWVCALAGLGDARPEVIDRMLAEALAGADGVQFWPFLTTTAPLRLPPGTRGRISGLQLHHGPQHILRAAVEGLAFELKRTLQGLTACNRPVRKLIMSGGAAASEVTPGIIADVCGLPVACHHGDASLLGAGILARTLLAPNTPLARLSVETAKPTTTFAPGDAAEAYAPLYKQYTASLPLQT